MSITDNDIIRLETAINTGPAPAWDPDFQIIKALLLAVGKQAERIRNLQAQIDILEETVRNGQDTLEAAVLAGLGVPIVDPTVSQEDIDRVVNDLEKTIEAARSGANIAQYVVPILKFVRSIVI
jgi:hypothetical protein